MQNRVGNLTKVLSEAENVLNISAEDYRAKDFETIMNNVRVRCGRVYHMDFNRSIEEQASSAMVGTIPATFIDNIYALVGKFAGIQVSMMFHEDVPISLKNINGLGISNNAWLAIFRSLCRKHSVERMATNMKTIENNLVLYMTGTEIRLLTILCVAYELELYELSASIAGLFICGGYFE